MFSESECTFHISVPSVKMIVTSTSVLVPRFASRMSAWKSTSLIWPIIGEERGEALLENVGQRVHRTGAVGRLVYDPAVGLDLDGRLGIDPVVDEAVPAHDPERRLVFFQRAGDGQDF